MKERNAACEKVRSPLVHRTSIASVSFGDRPGSRDSDHHRSHKSDFHRDSDSLSPASFLLIAAAALMTRAETQRQASARWLSKPG